MDQVYQITSLERRGHSFLLGRKEGREEGREEGRAQAKADGLRLAIFDIIEVRDLAIDDALRDRIMACEDPLALDHWRTLAKRCPQGAKFGD